MTLIYIYEHIMPRKQALRFVKIMIYYERLNGFCSLRANLNTPSDCNIIRVKKLNTVRGRRPSPRRRAKLAVRVFFICIIVYKQIKTTKRFFFQILTCKRVYQITRLMSWLSRVLFISILTNCSYTLYQLPSPNSYHGKYLRE